MLIEGAPRENRSLEPGCFLPNLDPFWDDRIVSGARVFYSDFVLNLGTVNFGLVSECSHVLVDKWWAHLCSCLAGGFGDTWRMNDRQSHT